jgi:hypothetical protein
MAKHVELQSGDVAVNLSWRNVAGGRGAVVEVFLTAHERRAILAKFDLFVDGDPHWHDYSLRGVARVREIEADDLVRGMSEAVSVHLRGHIGIRDHTELVEIVDSFLAEQGSKS